MSAITDARRWDADTRWKPAAACVGKDPDLFFPVYEVDEAAAKAVCDGCPVKDDCLQWALDTNEPHGIWGGLNDRERQNLRKRMMRRGWQPPAVTMPAAPDRRAVYEHRSIEVWGRRP